MEFISDRILVGCAIEEYFRYKTELVVLNINLSSISDLRGNIMIKYLANKR
jgi:hypothetical protein